MSKHALVLAGLLLIPVLGGCFSGEAVGAFSDENQISHDGRPSPGNNDYGEHLGGWATTQWNKSVHSAHTLHWLFLNTNSEDVPYETYFGDQLPRSMNTMGKTFDHHLFNYDWDDPFNGERW